MPMAETATLSDTITTKEELDEWKERIARQRRERGEPVRPPGLDPKNYRRGGWQDDVNLLVAFLKGIKNIMDLLIKYRVPEQPAALFAKLLPEVERNINWAISDLYDIVNAPDPTSHPCYVGLQVRDLTA